jgi:small subunit ribosomal protein S7
MSRRHRAEKRVINPDPKFGDLILSKFMNNLMTQGKKSVAEGIVYGAFDLVIAKSKADPIQLFHQALDNVAPAIEVRSRRVGGATYQVPTLLNKFRSTNIAVRWIVEFSRKRAGKGMSLKLANELLEAAKGLGNAIKKKEETHKMAEANKAFAQFR